MKKFSMALLLAGGAVFTVNAALAGVDINFTLVNQGPGYVATNCNNLPRFVHTPPCPTKVNVNTPSNPAWFYLQNDGTGDYGTLKLISPTDTTMCTVDVTVQRTKLGNYFVPNVHNTNKKLYSCSATTSGGYYTGVKFKYKNS